MPAQQPQSGDQAVRNTIGSFTLQIFDEMFSSDGTSGATSGSSSTTSGSDYTQPSLADLLPSEMSSKPTLADVVEAAKSNPNSP